MSALDVLRQLFLAAGPGAPIDPRAAVDAVAAAVLAGEDVGPVLRAHDGIAFVWMTRLGDADGAALARKARAQGWRSAIRMCGILGWSAEWAAAMTAHFGPTGLHPSWCDANGCPTPETLAECPGVRERMAEAEERWEHLIAWRERDRRATRWEYVVTMRKAP